MACCYRRAAVLHPQLHCMHRFPDLLTFYDSVPAQEPPHGPVSLPSQFLDGSAKYLWLDIASDCSHNLQGQCWWAPAKPDGSKSTRGPFICSTVAMLWHHAIVSNSKRQSKAILCIRPQASMNSRIWQLRCIGPEFTPVTMQGTRLIDELIHVPLRRHGEAILLATAQGTSIASNIPVDVVLHHCLEPLFCNVLCSSSSSSWSFESSSFWLHIW